MSDERDFRRACDELAKRLTDEGKLIEAGFVGLRLAAIPNDAPEVQVNEMRMAFFAGAQHLFASIMQIMDEAREPTEADLERMGLIDRELQEFVASFKERIADA